jgi:hypothetical protein
MLKSFIVVDSSLHCWFSFSLNFEFKCFVSFLLVGCVIYIFARQKNSSIALGFND